MDGIDNAVLGEEPELIAPFLRISIRVLGIVVVDKMGVSDVRLEGRVERSVTEEGGKTHT